MALRALISYDDTEADRDALILGGLLARAGARLTLAYVRHPASLSAERDRLELREAEAMLARGAAWLERPEAGRRVIVAARTADGLRWLAQEQGAMVIVFGSAYRTCPGHVSLCATAEALLDGGPAALALAPAGCHRHGLRRVETVGVLPGSADEAAIETAFSLAAAHGARVVAREHGVDLLVVGSRSEAPAGRVMISSRSRCVIEQATAPVLVVARGLPLEFEALVAAC